MATLISPRSANTPAKRVRYWARAWRKLHEWHERERVKRQGKSPTAEDLKAWYLWERGTWMPAMKALGVPLIAARERLVDSLPPNVDRTNVEGLGAIVGRQKKRGWKESSWDKDLPRMGSLALPIIPRELPDPLVNFTEYSSVDPGNAITISNLMVAWNDLCKSLVSYVWYDYGVDHFAGDFEHLFECQWDDVQGLGVCYFWMLANVLGGASSIMGANEDVLYFSRPSATVYLAGGDNGSWSFDTTTLLSSGIAYFMTIQRDESVGEFGTLYALARTSSHAGTLVDTLVAPLLEKQDFRYHYPCHIHGGTAGTIDGYVRDMDLQEAAASIAVLRRRREGY